MASGWYGTGGALILTSAERAKDFPHPPCYVLGAVFDVFRGGQPRKRLLNNAGFLGAAPSAAENHSLGPLPQHFADRFGWREMTDAVARAYAALPIDERGSALIVASNYGEAGALNYHGRAHGLPRAVSQHNNFYLWGPGRADARVVITVGLPAEDLAEAFESVVPAARFESPWAMPYETRHPVHVCRGLRLPLDEAWRRGKSFI